MNSTGQKVAAAFVKARKGMTTTVTKDAKGNFGRYATLAAVMEAITTEFANNGLALVQEVTVGELGVMVGCAIIHESGETITFEPLGPVPLAQRTAQGIGSAITYARRYQLTAICGLAPDDDDGQEATKGAQNGRAPSNHTAPPPKTQQPPSTPVEEADSDGPTEEELEILSEWSGGIDAQKWAVAEGYCKNEHEARNSFKGVVERQFGGKFTTGNQHQVLLAFLRDQLEKVEA